MFIHPLNNLGQFFSHSLIRPLACTSHIIIGPLADVQSILRTDCKHTPTTKNAPKILLIYRSLRNGVLFFLIPLPPKHCIGRCVTFLVPSNIRLTLNFFCDSRVWWQAGVLILSYWQNWPDGAENLQCYFNYTTLNNAKYSDQEQGQHQHHLTLETTGSKTQVSPIMTYRYRR